MKHGTLKAFERNVHSQNGEDGVFEEILKRIAQNFELDKWCVEFGAWDGVYLSNTCRLIRERDYSAVLIEGDPQRAGILRSNFPSDKIIKLCRFVEMDGDNSLENILSETPIPQGFDFLSIDVDGMDYYVFESVILYRPKVVCIEFNPSIPNAVDFVQKRSPSIKQGASAKAIVRLAESKGYGIAHSTLCNLIFVRDDLIGNIFDDLKKLEELNLPGNDPTYVFVGYDGTLLSNKDHVKLIWHRINYPIEKLQPIPSLLRIYTGDYGAFRRFLLRSWWALRNPLISISRLKRKFF